MILTIFLFRNINYTISKFESFIIEICLIGIIISFKYNSLLKFRERQCRIPNIGKIQDVELDMIKVLNPSVVKIVGSVASVLLRHLKYWKDSSKKDVIYRTNAQLVEDLEGMYSESQVQRAKKKLVEHGLIEVTYGKGYNRTTHYTLTAKAESLLQVEKKKEAPVVETTTTSEKPKKQQSSKYTSRPFQKVEDVDNRPASMKASFDEAGRVSENVVKGVPEELKRLIGLKDKKKVEKVETEIVVSKELAPLPTIVADEEFFNAPAFTDEPEQDDMSDEEYFGITPEQWIAMDMANSGVVQQEETLNVGEIMNMAFNRIPNVEIREKNREMLNASQYFKEDY